MTISPAAARLTNTFSHSWAIGGALLLGAVAVGLTANQTVGGVSFIGALFFTGKAMIAASMIVFAVGLRRAESVTGRRPLGTFALVLLALWSFLGNTVLFADYVNPGFSLFLGYLNSFVLFVLALIAVTQIARARVIPRSWNLAPAVILAINGFTWLLLQLVSSFLSVWPASGASAPAVLLIIADTLVSIGGLVVLGVIAIVIADRTMSRETESLPSTTA